MPLHVDSQLSPPSHSPYGSLMVLGGRDKFQQFANRSIVKLNSTLHYKFHPTMSQGWRIFYPSSRQPFASLASQGDQIARPQDDQTLRSKQQLKCREERQHACGGTERGWVTRYMTAPSSQQDLQPSSSHQQPATHPMEQSHSVCYCYSVCLFTGTINQNNLLGVAAPL